MKTKYVLFVFFCNLLIQNITARSKYVSPEEDNPYEFGFTIDGQQHRHEKKDVNGIIQGEFGFITADGVYHVTVYATDENGNYKILSMKNVRISGPLDQPNAQLPDTSQFAKDTPKKTIAPVAAIAPNPLSIEGPKIPVQSITSRPEFTTRPTIKPACAGCGYVELNLTNNNNNNKLNFQTDAFNKNKQQTGNNGSPGHFNQGGNNFNQGGNKPYQNGNQGGNQFNQGGNQFNQGGNKPFNQGGNQPFNQGGSKPFNQGGNQPFNQGGNQPFNQGGNQPFNQANEPSGTPHDNTQTIPQDTAPNFQHTFSDLQPTRNPQSFTSPDNSKTKVSDFTQTQTHFTTTQSTFLNNQDSSGHVDAHKTNSFNSDKDTSVTQSVNRHFASTSAPLHSNQNTDNLSGHENTFGNADPSQPSSFSNPNVFENNPNIPITQVSHNQNEPSVFENKPNNQNQANLFVNKPNIPVKHNQNQPNIPVTQISHNQYQPNVFENKPNIPQTSHNQNQPNDNFGNTFINKNPSIKPEVSSRKNIDEDTFAEYNRNAERKNVAFTPSSFNNASPIDNRNNDYSNTNNDNTSSDLGGNQRNYDSNSNSRDKPFGTHTDIHSKNPTSSSNNFNGQFGNGNYSQTTEFSSNNFQSSSDKFSTNGANIKTPSGNLYNEYVKIIASQATTSEDLSKNLNNFPKAHSQTPKYGEDQILDQYDLENAGQPFTSKPLTLADPVDNSRINPQNSQGNSHFGSHSNKGSINNQPSNDDLINLNNRKDVSDFNKPSSEGIVNPSQVGPSSFSDNPSQVGLRKFDLKHATELNTKNSTNINLYPAQKSFEDSNHFSTKFIPTEAGLNKHSNANLNTGLNTQTNLNSNPTHRGFTQQNSNDRIENDYFIPNLNPTEHTNSNLNPTHIGLNKETNANINPTVNKQSNPTQIGLNNGNSNPTYTGLNNANSNPTSTGLNEQTNTNTNPTHTGLNKNTNANSNPTHAGVGDRDLINPQYYPTTVGSNTQNTNFNPTHSITAKPEQNINAFKSSTNTPITNKSFSSGNNIPSTHPASGADLVNPLSLPESSFTDRPPTGITVSKNEINVPNNPPIKIQDKYPNMVDGLPAGISKDDITGILYKFNYTVGFHGHYEKGYKNGAKVGGYFVTDRDGVSRVVTYVADEFGYRPKVKLVRLDLTSDLVPKEGTEKTFGLKNFEFVWYPLD